MPDFPGPSVPPEAPASAPATPRPVTTAPVRDEATVFAELAADLNAPVEVKEELWPLPHRPGWFARYRHIADYSQIERATKQSDRARRKGNRRPGDVDIDVLRVAAILLSTHNTGIMRQGRPWTDKDGADVTFSHPEFLEALGVNTAREACIKAYGWDADVIKHGDRLQTASGWEQDTGDDGEADPTVVE